MTQQILIQSLTKENGYWQLTGDYLIVGEDAPGAYPSLSHNFYIESFEDKFGKEWEGLEIQRLQSVADQRKVSGFEVPPHAKVVDSLDYYNIADPM